MFKLCFVIMCSFVFQLNTLAVQKRMGRNNAASAVEKYKTSILPVQI